MRGVFFLLALLMLLRGMAQAGFAYTHISMQDGTGLNADLVNVMHQDHKGFIWIGTANGLQRFDGNKFTSINIATTSHDKLPVSNLTTILEFSRQELLLYFPEKMETGVYNTSNNTYRHVSIQNNRPLPANSSTRVWKDKPGNFYITIYRYGILRYDTARHVFADYNGFKLPKGWWPEVYSFEDTLTKRIWFPCPDSGLVLYDRKTNQSYTRRNNAIHHPLLQQKNIQQGVTEFYIDSKRRYWIFSWGNDHIRRCFNEKGETLQDTAGLGKNAGYAELRYFFESKKGMLALYGTNAFYIQEPGRHAFNFISGNTNTVGEVQYSVIHYMMEDADGSIWLATDRGIYFTSGLSATSDVVNMQFKHTKNNLEFTDILQLNSGEYFLSSWGNGIVTLSSDFKPYEAGIYRHFKPQTALARKQYLQAWSLYQDKNNNVWIGCQAGKYIVYHPATGNATFGELKEAKQATIRYITGTKKNVLFIGTQRGQLIRYSNGVFTNLHQFNSIVRKILIDDEESIWVATEGSGLYCLDANGEKVIHHYAADNKPYSLFQNICFDLEQLNDSTILCAAGALNFVNKKTSMVSWLSVANGLPANNIMRIRRDEVGFMWMITKNGLCRYNPLNHRITSYDRKDGITLAHMTTEADYFSKDGRVMFAGGTGLLYFKSALFKTVRNPPDVVITDFLLHNRQLIVDSLQQLPVVRLEDNENSFTIGFSSLSFLMSDKLTYYYRLKGANNEWTSLNGFGTVSYALLAPGKYEFEVYSETIDGFRSRGTTVLKLYIMPPVWQTYWFWSAALTVAAMIAYAMHRLHINRLLAVEKLRNRVARDLHDDMGSTLSTINILSSMAKAKLNTDTMKTAEYINKISDNSQRMMEAMDDIVWAIKPSNDNMQKVVGRMREFATSVFEAKETELVFNVADDVADVKLNMEARRDFFLVFKEAVNNAAKYSGCTQVTIHIYVKASQLMLMVADNGIGFNVKTADGGNGLGNMQKRAVALKAKLDIQSVTQHGTTVKLAVPLNQST